MRSISPSEGRKARQDAGELALEALYGPGETDIILQTQYGGREPDLITTNGDRTYGHESSVAEGSVRAGTHKLGQALKAYDRMQLGRGYSEIWHFWDGPPVPNLAATLRAFGIPYIVYNR